MIKKCGSRPTFGAQDTAVGWKVVLWLKRRGTVASRRGLSKGGRPPLEPPPCAAAEQYPALQRTVRAMGESGSDAHLPYRRQVLLRRLAESVTDGSLIAHIHPMSM
jgi:hypothetical protein